MAKKPVTSTILRVYLLAGSRQGKQEGTIVVQNSPGKFEPAEVHFDYLDDIPDKIRQLLRNAGIKWPPQRSISK